MTTAVIPVHNRADLLSKLLDSMDRQTARFSEVIVVDNASSDHAAQIARERGCRVISMNSNAGFARAVNRGWQAAATPLIAVLNSDVELDPAWLAQLESGIGMYAFATGLLLNARQRDRVDGSYDLVSRSACAWRAGFGEPVPATRAPSAISIAPATACIFRRDILCRLHGFDEAYESYLEDVDFGLRCVRDGLDGVFVPEAIAFHHGSATLGRWDPRVVRLISRNQLRLVARNYDRTLFRACLWNIIAGQMLWGLVALRHGAAAAWLAGKREGLRDFHLEGTPSLRVRNFLFASEAEISRRARDSYWRWYFRLTRAAD